MQDAHKQEPFFARNTYTETDVFPCLDPISPALSESNVPYLSPYRLQPGRELLRFPSPSNDFVGGRVGRRGRHRHLTEPPNRLFLLTLELVKGRAEYERPTIPFPSPLPATISFYLPVPSTGMSHLSPSLLPFRVLALAGLSCLGSRSSTYRSASLPRKKQASASCARHGAPAHVGRPPRGSGLPPSPNAFLPGFPFMHHSVHSKERVWVVVAARRLPVPMAAPVSWVAFWAVGQPAVAGREEKVWTPILTRFHNLVTSSHALSGWGILIVSYIGGYLLLFQCRPPPLLVAKLTKMADRK
jgi:hypothetical protein